MWYEHLTANRIQAIASIGSLGATVFGFVFVWRQIRQVRRAAVAQASIALGEQSLTILSYVAAHPATYPYLYDGKELHDGDANRVAVICLCEMVANYCELTAGMLPDLDSEAGQRWINFVRDTVRLSPAMQHFLRDRSAWYSPQLYSLLVDP